MSGQIDFYGSSDEEFAVLEYLARDGAVAVRPFARPGGGPEILDLRHLPSWPEPFSVHFWLPRAGDVVYHYARPEVSGKTHGELVADLLTSEAWPRLHLKDGEGVVNNERSPVLIFERRGVRANYQLPSRLINPASTPNEVSPEFAKWVRQVWSWIRRKAVAVHSWREPNDRLRNDFGFVNSVYAFPEVLERVASKPGSFAISVRNT